MKRFLALGLFSAAIGVLAFVLASSAKDAGPGPIIVNVETIMGTQLDPHATPIKEVPLGQTATSNGRVLMVSDDIAAHSHADHDEILFVMRGKGDLMLAGNTREVRRGDLIFIPKGTVHSFINTGGGFAGILSIVSPAFDGKDEIPAAKSR